MEVNKIIEGLEASIDFYKQTRGGAPVCMLEAVKLLKAHNNKADTVDKQAFMNKTAELRDLMRAAGGDFMALHISENSMHVSIYNNFEDEDKTETILEGSWYDDGENGWTMKWRNT